MTHLHGALALPLLAALLAALAHLTERHALVLLASATTAPWLL
jgi:hypothetical protein